MTPSTVRLYVAAIAAAKIGTGFFFLINTWLIIGLTGAPSSAALSLVMTVLPSLILSPLIGVAVDRGNPARLAWRAELLRWLVLMLYGAAYWAGWATAPLGYAVSFGIAAGNEIQQLAWRAAVARTADPALLLRLNAQTVVGGQAGQIFGAALSGFALAWFGPVATLGLAASTYLVSAGFGALVARRLAEPAAVETPRDYLADLGAGFRHIAERPEIAFFYALILANMSVIFGINGMLAPFVRDTLGLPAEDFGVIDAGYALGAIASGLVIVRLAERFGRRAMLLTGFALAASSLLALAQAQGMVGAALPYIGLGASFQGSVIALSAAQRATDPSCQGRVAACFNTLNGLMGLAVYGLVALVADSQGYRLLYLAQAGFMLALLPAVLWASRRARIGRLLRSEGPMPAGLAKAGAAALLCLALLPATAQATEVDLRGTWVLVAADVIQPDGTRQPDYGPAPQGRLMIDAEGRYALEIYRSDRPVFAGGDKHAGMPGDYRAAVLGESSHFGRLRIDAETGELVFSIEAASFPNWQGTEQRRRYSLDGDELSYRVAPRPDGGVPISVWRRVQ